MLLMLLLSNEYFMSHVHEHYKGIRPPAPLFFFWGGGWGRGKKGRGEYLHRRNDNAAAMILTKSRFAFKSKSGVVEMADHLGLQATPYLCQCTDIVPGVGTGTESTKAVQRLHFFCGKV